MPLHRELGEMCNRIKHTPDEVDLADVRALLRRSQLFIDQVEYVMAGVDVTVPGERLTRLIEESTAGAE